MALMQKIQIYKSHEKIKQCMHCIACFVLFFLLRTSFSEHSYLQFWKTYQNEICNSVYVLFGCLVPIQFYNESALGSTFICKNHIVDKLVVVKRMTSYSEINGLINWYGIFLVNSVFGSHKFFNISFNTYIMYIHVYYCHKLLFRS